MTRAHEELLQEFRGYTVAAPTVQALMERIAKRLHEKMTALQLGGFLSGRSDGCKLFGGRTFCRQFYAECANST